MEKEFLEMHKGSGSGCVWGTVSTDETKRRKKSELWLWVKSPSVLCVLSRFSRVWLCATPWTVASQASLSTGFSRQEYLSGLPCPFPGASSQLRDRTHVPYISFIGRQVLCHYRHLESITKILYFLILNATEIYIDF